MCVYVCMFARLFACVRDYFYVCVCIRFSVPFFDSVVCVHVCFVVCTYMCLCVCVFVNVAMFVCVLDCMFEFGWLCVCVCG